MDPTAHTSTASAAVATVPATPGPAHGGRHDVSGARLRLLCLGALGVVYGDIGTSPLYSLRECFHGEHGVAVSTGNILGVLSLIFWALIVVVMLKYHVYVLRLDNQGEGGILALMALVRETLHSPRSQRIAGWLSALGLFGAALLYGDGIITPAISVLSAVEGLEVATKVFQPYVVPITIAILIGLFVFQRRGTGGIGAIFGPVMLVWFSTLATLGGFGLVRNPHVLAAVNPMHAVRFFAHDGFHGFLVLGAVFLVTTGGEALYADLGHFGEKPIQIDWFLIVMPALLLNYFGQGALMLADPAAAENPFYNLVPRVLVVPLVVLSTAATVIASQAVISGAFSLTRQAVQLGYAPRVEIVHTSAAESGQIYIPGINWALMAATIWLVLGFRTSSGLAAAYGIAVTMTMVITTLLAGVATHRIWRWPLAASVAVTVAFLGVDLAFLGSNIFKIAQGGWLPLLVGIAGYVLMSTWQWGRGLLAEDARRARLPVDLFLADVAKRRPPRAPISAVFLSATDGGVPRALLHNFKHNKVLHEQVLLLTVVTEPVPYVLDGDRRRCEPLGEGFYRVTLRYGFMEDPDVPRALAALAADPRSGVAFDPQRLSYFLGADTLVSRDGRGLALWRESLFGAMRRNATGALRFFHLPANRVVELGGLVELRDNRLRERPRPVSGPVAAPEGA